MALIRVGVYAEEEFSLAALRQRLAEQRNMQVVFFCQSMDEFIEHIRQLPPHVALLEANLNEDPFKARDTCNIIGLLRGIYRSSNHTRIVALLTNPQLPHIASLTRMSVHGIVARSPTCLSDVMIAIDRAANGRLHYCPEIKTQLLSLTEPPKLTARQIEIIRTLAQAMQQPELTHADIARMLFISPTTLEVHLTNIRSTLDVHSTREIVPVCIKFGLLE
jgi:DNA-binding NarL/FixJ family response regulator